MEPWSLKFRGHEFRDPTFTVFEEQGRFYIHENDSTSEIEDPTQLLRERAEQTIIAGAIGYEFAWVLDDVHTEQPPNISPSLWVGGFAESTPAVLPDVVDGVLSSITPPDRDRYVSDVDACRQEIWNGELFEVNYTGRFDGTWSGSASGLFALLSSRASGEYMGLLESEQFAIVSVSPECFLHIEETKVVTKPIKGTRAASVDENEDSRIRLELLNSEKDRAENVMIVDLMRNDLSRFCRPGSVRATQICQLESFRGLHHLVSEVRGELSKNVSPLEILFGCFPAGSITGAPKLRAIEIAATLEKRPREFYTGSLFASWPDGRLESSVAIRTAVLTKENHGWNLMYGAGGAVVADSVSNDEYQEALTKASYLEPRVD